jgi:hypothetical protein
MKQITKTEQLLLNRARMYNNGSETYVNGKREYDAAKKLVARGMAKEFINLSGMSKGEYYIHPFTRRAGTTRAVFVYSGTLKF